MMTNESEQSAFGALGLRSEIADTVADLGYEVPTPIQEQTIPLLLAGRDVMGQAQTGTGKTAAFALPILQGIDPKSRSTQALILTPTRELAMQVAEAIHSYSRRLGPVSVQPIYGGAPIGLQLRHLQRGVQIVVGTPGRLLDHLDRGSLDLGGIRVLVIDEADEMLRMGFIEDVERILAATPKQRQVALFSATMPPEVTRIAKVHLRDPERVEIRHGAGTTPAIEQRVLNISENQKLEVLTQILELEPSEAVLIFRRTRVGAAELADKLEARGFAAVALHGDMNQSMREGVVRKLRSGQVEIVVATDVAARGLDVEQIAHVINYDIPNDVEAYVHRIGRTGRAGRSGVATLFVTHRERRMLREIERFTGTSIATMKMPTQADVAARRVDLLKESIREEVLRGDLDLYHQLVEQLVNEGAHDIAEIAAAAVRLASAGRAPAITGEAASPGEGATARKASASTRQATARAKDPEEPKVQLMLSIGRDAGIRPADVVGSIANEADIPGSVIGPIDIRDEITLVGLPERYAKHVISALQGVRFRGNRVEIRIATDADRNKPARPTAAGRRAASADRGKKRSDGPGTRGPGNRTDRKSGPKRGGGSKPHKPAGGPKGPKKKR